MKKMFAFSVITLTFVVLASCKKDYLCECTVSGWGASGNYDTLLVDMTKKEAKNECDDMDGSFFGVTQDCNLE